jgi:poly(ADP-ribose) glycohydrolase ARH3
MMLCVADWLLEDERHAPERLLARFAEAYEPWRRYGSGTEAILRQFPKFKNEWREFATAMFPFGSYGNGSAMRAAPIGLVYHRDLEKAAAVAVASSRPTHSHSLAYQGVELQVIAVASAVSCDKFSPNAFIPCMRGVLTRYSELLQDTSKFEWALNNIEEGLRDGRSCKEMSAVLGTGVTAQEAVPMAIYCFLRHPESYCDVIREAVFIGGDTDTIACMAGAISGAFLGASAIPSKWLGAVREETHSVSALEVLADRLFAKFTADS